MEGKTVSFNTHCNLYESQLESVAKWLSCNGEVWGMGPTVVFASAAALFLYNELEATVFMPGDHARVSLLEKTLVSTMVLGMLALMIHLWVCSMRFFQYYLDTLIKDSPNVLLEMTTAGLLGSQSEMVPLGPLTRFLKQQQPQIHITVCWFLSLCYADYVRKHYCQRFNMPYLEQWQTELQERASRGVNRTVEKMNTLVTAIQLRLRGFTYTPPTSDAHTGLSERTSAMAVGGANGCSWGAVGGAWGPGGGAGGARGPRVSSEPALGRAPQRARLVSQASETTADAIAKLRAYIALFEWAKCGESGISTLPTLLWALGSAALAQRLVAAIFRRFMFRRVPLWEVMLQQLLFIWMIIYSLHFWVVVVKVIKFLIEYCYEMEEVLPTSEDVESCKMMQQWMIWMCGVTPLALFLHMRPKAVAPPLMIWITTNPWQRREMGPYGYYLNRPLSLRPSSNSSILQQAFTLRRAFSDSKTFIKDSPKKRRISKSV